MDIDGLYQLIDDKDYTVVALQLESTPAAATPDGCIAVNPEKIETRVEEKVLLAHEVGHLETGAFYDAKTSQTVRGKCEVKASRWAINELVPAIELRDAITNGTVEVYQLADLFDVTERMIIEATEYYRSTGRLHFAPEEEAAAKEVSEYRVVEAIYRGGKLRLKMLVREAVLEQLPDESWPPEKEKGQSIWPVR